MKTIETMRQDIQKYLETADDETVKMFHEMMDSGIDDISWDTLPDEVKTNVLAALEESKNGEVIPHEEIQKRYQKWLK